MRLFYILFFFAISAHFTVFASQKIQGSTLSGNVKISFVTGKKATEFKPDYHSDNDSIQKDLINTSNAKISSAAFLLLTFLLFIFIRNNSAASKVIIKRLNYNYWCLFKMLYPKHVFW